MEGRIEIQENEDEEVVSYWMTLRKRQEAVH
jgi:hypothetical protein